jgi:flagellar hook-associated protein 1 FlgK
MSLSQALSVALAGVHVTQQGLSVIAGNVANANTPGYVEETIAPVELAVGGNSGTSVDVTGINRNLNTLLQSQLWTESSGGSYANMASQIYQQLQQVYGTPGSSSSFDAIYNNFTSALQALSTSPSSYSNQAAVIGAAQQLTQNLNGMTSSVQQLRSQAESGIATDVQTVNGALQQIANINLQLESAAPDSATASLEDQRDQYISQISQLMNVRVVRNSNNQLSLFTSTGQQLVNGVQASQLTFANAGTLTATSLWNANPTQDGAGTITLTSPSGATTDMIATGAIQSGEIGAYLQMRDTILPQAQTQLDELANQMSQALANQTTAGTAVTSGAQAGFNLDVGSVLPGNTASLTYTDSGNVQHTITMVAMGPGGSLPLQASPSNPNNQIIGINFAAGMASAVAQLNAAFGANLQFTNPSGTVLQALNAGATTNVVNALSATSTVTSLTSGSPQLPMFLDGSTPITGALSANGSQTTGLAGRITVNPALAAAPASLVAYAVNTAAGDGMRPNFMLNQMTNAMLTYSPSTGIGSAQQPFSGSLPNFMSAIVSQQSQAANAASNLQQGQSTVVSALQQRFNNQSGVSIDTELSNLIALQNAYGANARVMSTVQQMMATLLQMGA